MRNDKEETIELRRLGMSYKDISLRMRIPKSTLSEWFKNERWSKEIREKLDAAARVGHRVRIIELDRVRGVKLAEIYERARQEARVELEVLKYHPLFVSGIMLYWGEGDKATKGVVRLANVDPALLRVYLQFLRNVLQVEKLDIKISLLLYPDLDDLVCREYWSKELGVDLTNFIKNIHIVGRHKTKRVRYGVCSVYVSSTYLKVKMLEWLRLLPEELKRGDYYASI